MFVELETGYTPLGNICQYFRAAAAGAVPGVCRVIPRGLFL